MPVVPSVLGVKDISCLLVALGPTWYLKQLQIYKNI